MMHIFKPEVGTAEEEFLSQNGFRDLIPIVVKKHQVFLEILLGDFSIFSLYLT